MSTVPNQTIVPPIVPGQSPGNNQVNLDQMRTGLSNILAPGMLGNNVANPMTDIIAKSGNAGLGYQNAIANSRMEDIALQAQMQQLQQAEQQYALQQQQPGMVDYLSTGLSGLGTLEGMGVFGPTKSNLPYTPFTPQSGGQ